ncbi:transcriptional regulator [Alphaproteobacteria bacterium]|nr:transcriptional regulator [Alphaproteobacteria bacterium]
MSDAILKLLLIDRDTIYRTGLRVLIEEFADLAVVAEADSEEVALQVLEIGDCNVDLVVLALYPPSNQSKPIVALELGRQIKLLYPNLPILLISAVKEPTQLAIAKAIGIDGYCFKDLSIFEIVTVIKQVAKKQFVWLIDSQININIFSTIRENWRLSGLQQIEGTLQEVSTQLQVPGLTVLEKAIFAGHRRELLASRWLVNWILKPQATIINAGIYPKLIESAKVDIGQSFLASNQSLIQQSSPPSIFAAVRDKLQFSLDNLTDVPLEIDFLKLEKKRELLEIVLAKIESIIEQLNTSKVQLEQLPKIRQTILIDLWQAATTEFFGKYSTIQENEENIEITNILLQNAEIVKSGLLPKIPLVRSLFSYLLFATPLVIDNTPYSAPTPEAMARAEILLQNLLIEIANAVVQPLLNKLGDVEVIKQKFYDSSLISTREIERFRNNLSWKYRLKEYITEPKLMFESRYDLFVLASRGIAKVSIYAPRNQELKKLTGIPLVVTLALELRDAISPRLRGAIAFLGSSVVYVLTQVVGRAIGLIGRGVLQGISGSFPTDKFGKDNQKYK